MAWYFGGLEMQEVLKLKASVRPSQRDVDTVELSHLCSRLVHQHRYPEAAKVLSVLARRVRSIPYLVFQSMARVLRSDQAYKKQCQEFYEMIIEVAQLTHKPRLVLEFALYLSNSGELTLASQLLERSLTLSPFDMNPNFHGYCGLFEAALAQSPSRAGSMADTHRTRAIGHLRTALELNADTDIFITKLLQLLHETNKPFEAVYVAHEYSLDNPRQPNAHRLLYEVITNYYEKHLDARLVVLRQLAECDPTSETLQDAVQLYLQAPADLMAMAKADTQVKPLVRGNKRKKQPPTRPRPGEQPVTSATSESELSDHARRVELLGSTQSTPDTAWRLVTVALHAACSRVECPPWINCPQSWEVLVELLRKLPSSFNPLFNANCESLYCWKGRLTWWKHALFTDKTPFGMEAGQATRLRAARATCYGLLFGDS